MPRRWPVLVAALLLVVAALLAISACQQAEPTTTSVPSTSTAVVVTGRHNDPCGPATRFPFENVHKNFLHWTRGDTHLVFDVQDSIWTLELENGLTKRIVDANAGYDGSGAGIGFLYGFYADMPPHSSRIVYSTCEYLLDEPTGSDGVGSIVYSQGYEIATANLDGTDKRRITDSVRFVGTPVLSPDGTSIVFLTNRHRGGPVDSLHYPDYSPELQEYVRLAILPSDSELADDDQIGWALFGSPDKVALFPPQWSPDGNYLAYMEYDGERRPYDLVVHTVLADRTGMNHRIGVTTALPTWSPNSNELSFATLDEGRVIIYVVKPDGSGMRHLWRAPITSESVPVSELSWSPDGSQLLFVADHTYLIGTDGSGLRRLEGIPGEYGGVRPVAWSPDGSRIAIYNPDHGIITIAPDGTGLRTLFEIDADGQPRLIAETPSEAP